MNCILKSTYVPTFAQGLVSVDTAAVEYAPIVDAGNRNSKSSYGTIGDGKFPSFDVVPLDSANVKLIN